jgi:hypothetical protein
MNARGLGVVALLVAGACIPETRLQPRPEARALAGDTSAAVAEVAGVRLIADGAAWNGHPANLERRLTPVEIRLENHSGRPLSLQYEYFDLVGESRFRYAALSPLRLDEATRDTSPLCVAGYSPGYGNWRGTWNRHRGWGRPSPWRRPWWPSPYYDPFYDPFYGPPAHVRCEEPLPTQDMLEQALPEGTLEDGGIVSGFLYFQGVAERERQVTLLARVVDAHSGEPLGELSIPFQVRQ